MDLAPHSESRDTGSLSRPLNREEKLSPVKLTIAQYIVAGILVILVTGLWRLQVVSADDYRVLAEANRIRKVPVLAPRGRLRLYDNRMLRRWRRAVRQEMHCARRQYAPRKKTGGQHDQRHDQDQAGTLALGASPPPFCHRNPARTVIRRIHPSRRAPDPSFTLEQVCDGILPHHDAK